MPKLALTATEDNTHLSICSHQTSHDERSTRLGEGGRRDGAQIAGHASVFSQVALNTPPVLVSRVLCDSSGVFAWWMPAGRRVHRFDVDWHKGVTGRGRLQGRRANIPHPPLVFITLEHECERHFVFALDRNERPLALSKLYQAPFLNVNTDGSICWGSQSEPCGPARQHFESIESAYFARSFSHINNGAVVRAGKRSCYEFLADLCDAPPAVFPESVLIERSDLQSTINLLAQRKRA